MENRELVNLLKMHALDRDKIEFSVGDTLDVKAGLLLVMLIFLAAQAHGLFQGDLNQFVKIIEWLSISAMIVGGLVTIYQLLPRKYVVLPRPTKFASWIEELKAHYAGEDKPGEQVLKLAEETEISQAMERVEKNVALNQKKVRLMKVSFACVVASFLANLAVLASTCLFPPHR